MVCEEAADWVSDRNLGRSSGALFAASAVVVLSVATDAALRAAGVFPALGQRPADSFLLLALSVSHPLQRRRQLTRGEARARPMQHALVSGVIGLVLSTAGAVATWNGGSAYEPKWYPLALIATAMPAAWAGGKLQGASSRSGIGQR